MDRSDRTAATGGEGGDPHRILIEAITDYAIYGLDPEGRITSWNPGAQRFKGYTADEIIGEHFSHFYTEEDNAAGLPARALLTAATAGRFEHEGWRVRKNGERFWAHVIIDPIRDRAGGLIGYAKVTRDLTERRRSERALRSSEEQFRRLVQSVTDYAIYMLDADGRITNWNSGAQRIKGYRPEEIIGEHFSRFYTEEDREAGAPAEGLRTAAAVGRFEKEGLRVRKDGGRFWAHVIIDAIYDDAGEVIGFAKVTRDITERREAQHALEQAREALFQSQKMEAIGQLTGGIAHDFNNLLMAVLGSLELLRKRMPHDPRLSALVENAIQGAERGVALTQRMLAFARKQELKLVAVDVRELVRNMTGLLDRSLGPGVQVRIRFPDDLPPVVTDANQLEVALLNLAINGRDAMNGDGVITITGEAWAVSGTGVEGLVAGDYVRLSVLDTGGGMDEDTLAHAAEPFFTTKGVGKGTGLGLPMVQGMAAQSGGRLVLKSRKGEGVTAELWLPVARDAVQPTPADADAPHEDIAPLAILAVDDDDLVLTNTASMLEDLGHRVTQASSAREALSVLKSGLPVDLVITDQAMPHMTGAELARVIRTERPALPVLLATGYAELPDADLAMPRLAKPFQQKALAQAIARMMAERTAASVG